MRIFGQITKIHSEINVYNILEKIQKSEIERLFKYAIFDWCRYGDEWQTDVILVGVAGVFVIEVKGGQIRIVDNEYFTYNVPTKPPMEQAKKNKSKLTEVLIKNGVHEHIANSGGYGVLYIDTDWKDDWDKRTQGFVLDKKFQHEPVKQLDKMVNFYKTRAFQKGWTRKPLTEEQITEIKNCLVANTKDVSDLRQAIDDNDRRFVELNPDQFDVYKNAEDNKRIIIKGPPGSGKTLLAYQILKDYEKKGIRTLYICKNMALANYLNAMFKKEVSNSPKFVKIAHIDGVVSEIDPALILIDKNYEELATKAAKTNASDTKSKFVYEYIVIDEGQDLMIDGYYLLIDSLIDGGIDGGSWCLFIDPEQDLFSSYDKDIFGIFEESASILKLSRNYRNTVEIQNAATILSGNSKPTKTSGIHGTEPIFIEYTNSSLDEGKLVSDEIHNLLNQEIKPEEITVLSFSRNKSSIAHKGLIKLKNGLKLVHVHNKDWTTNSKNEILYASVYEYKGLDNKVIIYTDVTGITEHNAPIKHLVGATRARSHYIVFVTPEVLKYLTDPKKGNLMFQINKNWSKLADAIVKTAL